MNDDLATGQQLIEDAVAAFRRDDRAASEGAATQALEISKRQDAPALEVEALVALSRLALRELDFERVEQLCREAQAAAERTGDREALKMPLHMRAEATRLQGRPADARVLYEQSLALNRELGDERMVGVELHNRAYVDIAEGRYDAAEESFRQSLDITERHTGGMRIPCVIGLGAVAAARGDGTRALRLLAAGDAAMRAEGEILDPADEPEFTRSVERARAAAGSDADRLWAEGAALTFDAAIEEARAAPDS